MSESIRRHGWQTVIPPPAEFPVEEGQFDDLEEAAAAVITNGKDINVRNLEVLFQSSKIKDDGDGERNEDLIDEDGQEDDSDFDDDDYQFYGENKQGPNSQRGGDHQTSEEMFKKYVDRIRVEKYEGAEDLPSGAGNKIIASSKKITANRQKVKDKQDRATVEQVMDPRTRMILFKLLSSEKMLSIDGCISTGKEANVYHATGAEGNSLAIKIFKTSILTFKARDKYVSGEYRFRQGYCKKNPRKMVRLWAEKEYRNLLRIHAAGSILVPQPRLLKSHVLVMDFIGSNGWPSPLLKDVKFENIEFDVEDEVPNREEQNPLQNLLRKLYRDCLIILYRLFKHCKLVHADFSEFNLILKDYKDLYVIDVSQSVEHDHPRSLDFLKSDIKNVQEFFGKHVLVGDFKEIFEFITGPTIDDSNYLNTLDDILSRSIKWEGLDVTTEVFRQSFIPRKMEEVVHFERDFDKVMKGEAELIYTNIMGMKSDFSGPLSGPAASLEKQERSANENGPGNCESSESDDDSSENSDEEGTSGSGFSNSARPKDETAEQRRERKKQVKQERAEKRQHKVKKHVKKRQEKMSHYNSKKK